MTEHILFRKMDVKAKTNQLKLVKAVVYGELEGAPDPGLLCFLTSLIERLHSQMSMQNL